MKGVAKDTYRMICGSSLDGGEFIFIAKIAMLELPRQIKRPPHNVCINSSPNPFAVNESKERSEVNEKLRRSIVNRRIDVHVDLAIVSCNSPMVSEFVENPNEKLDRGLVLVGIRSPMIYQ